MDIFASVTTIPGVGPAAASRLAKLGIHTVLDLLYHLPARYEDRSQYRSVSQLVPSLVAYVTGTVSRSKNIFLRSGKTLQTTRITDTTGTLDVVWFNQPFLLKNFKSGTRVAVWGKIDHFSSKLTMISPEYEIIPAATNPKELRHIGGIIPIYPETAGLTSKWFRNTVRNLLTNLPEDSPWPAPDDLPAWKESLTNIHFPKNANWQMLNAKYQSRLAYDELFLISFQVQYRKLKWQKTKLSHPFVLHKPSIDRFISSLPFKLTPSQETAVAQILIDLTQAYPMNRLLQGDVGSGKTVIAAIAAFVAHQNKLQTLILAPTQILVQQHFDTLSKLFAPFNLKIGLLTSSAKLETKHSTLDIIVGTHALLSDKRSFPSVGLIIIDEQQRFGVLQRARASLLGTSPHVLTMTATPIPRTAALVIHGDLDISLLEDLPSGRLPVKTWVVPENKRQDAYNWISEQISGHGARVFIICPFIDQSETLSSVKSAITEKERLTKIFPDRKLGLLHGKLDSSQKNVILEDFRSGKYDILVSTPVVEVGIDIPAATIVLIEDADRFGLSQLHQIRGRVGRSGTQSYCLLFSNTQAAQARLKLMEKNFSGGELSQLDLQMRGPGQVYGTSQHGNPYLLKVANYDDEEAMDTAKIFAQKALTQIKKYPLLQQLQKTAKISLIHPN